MKSLDLYHGTSEQFADSIKLNPQGIEVSRGGGELGRGFYLGGDISLAIIWAKARNRKPGVLEFEIDKSKYALLRLKRLSHGQVVNDWLKNKSNGNHRTHLYGTDVVIGPLSPVPDATQYKFESNRSQALLRTSPINRIL